MDTITVIALLEFSLFLTIMTAGGTMIIRHRQAKSKIKKKHVCTQSNHKCWLSALWVRMGLFNLILFHCYAENGSSNESNRLKFLLIQFGVKRSVYSKY